MRKIMKNEWNRSTSKIQVGRMDYSGCEFHIKPQMSKSQMQTLFFFKIYLFLFTWQHISWIINNQIVKSTEIVLLSLQKKKQNDHKRLMGSRFLTCDYSVIKSPFHAVNCPLSCWSPNNKLTWAEKKKKKIKEFLIKQS